MREQFEKAEIEFKAFAKRRKGYLHDKESFMAGWQAAVAAEREQLAKLLPTDADRYAYNLSEFYKHRKRLSEMDWATIISAANVLRECARVASAIRDGGKNG